MSTLLQNIQIPDQIKELAENQLPILATELRDMMITSLAETGGHLGASLGVVELTIALHYTFNTPQDKLVWDVGHQSYPHKILTGRQQRLHTLRQRHGLSGFPSRTESPYDAFGAGHSSTSISAALGMAVAARMRGQSQKTISIIGDGGMTAGLAFEGLNNAGDQDTDLIVILNDNDMSISDNVGALSRYLNRVITDPLYNKWRSRAEQGLNIFPPSLRKAAKRAEEHVKGMLIPGTLFEEMGFRYFGPIDGHDFDQLLPTLSNIKALHRPILLHVVTRKGKGYPPAEENQATYHGVGPFEPITGKLLKKSKHLSFSQVFGNMLVELATENLDIIGITAAMPAGTGMSKFQETFPHRFFDVGIAEQHAVTFAGGLACEGLHPVVAIYSTFMQRAYDQVIHDIALQNLAVVFILDRAGLVGADGPTHAGAFDISFLRAVPNLTMMAPADENELRHMLKTALTLNKPVVIRFPKSECSGQALEPAIILPEGKGRCLRSGNDLAILAIGSMVTTALQAADLLASKNIHASVYDFRYIKPLDMELLKQACNHPWLFTLEENTINGGFGACVIEALANSGMLDNGLHIRIWGLPDKFVPHGNRQELLAELQLDSASIADKIAATIVKN